MRPLRRSFVLSDIIRLFVCLASLCCAAALGGCAGGAERVYGFQAVASSDGADLDTDRRFSRMSRAQEEAIIAQAIVAHEIRRP